MVHANGDHGRFARRAGRAWTTAGPTNEDSAMTGFLAVFLLIAMPAALYKCGQVAQKIGSRVDRPIRRS